jgi:Uma2 family endonuclease
MADLLIGGASMSIGQRRATLDDLYNESGKAELIGGRIVQLMPTGYMPHRVAARIFRCLDDYATQRKIGEAFTDNMGFAVPELSSGRESFSPDAAFYDGKLPANRMRFIEGPPTFAVEVRSENADETEMADKRADYFEAGTKVVWDVDPIAECIHKYTSPTHKITYQHGQTADAEPAVPGWKVDVDWIFS